MNIVKSRYKKILDHQKGMVLVLFMIFTGLVFALLALVVGLGFIANNKMKLQDITNLASLGAVEAFYRESNPALRADKAKEVADSILRDNRLLAAKEQHNALEFFANRNFDIDSGMGLTPQSGGVIQFGNWFDAAPSGSCAAAPSPSGSSAPTGCECIRSGVFKPCFVPFQNKPVAANDEPNAVRIFTKLQSSNKIIAPFVTFLNNNFNPGGIFRFTSMSTAYIAERCTAMIVDVSPSAHADTHRFGRRLALKVETNPSLRVTQPALPGLFSFKTFPGMNTSAACNDTYPVVNAQGQIVNANNWFPEKLYWCSMPAQRSYSQRFDPQHYRSDYELDVVTPYGLYAVDKYIYPEPLRSIMLAYNAALRKLESQRVSRDKAMLFVFSENEIGGKVPGSGLTRDLKFLIDLTDMRRMGRFDYDNANLRFEAQQTVHPNFIDRGWFPTLEYSGTNVAQALNNAIDTLTNSNYCASSAKKSIIFATDGIATVFNGTTLTQYISSSGRGYLDYEQELIGRILQRLKDNKIYLTTLLTGEGVDPNFLNIRDPSSGRFLDFFQAVSRGYKGLQNPLFYLTEPGLPSVLPSVVSNSPPCNSLRNSDQRNECAFKYVGQIQGVQFRRPIGTLAHLSIESGGLFCPLLEPHRTSSGDIDENCYDQTTKELNETACPRVEGQPQRKAIRREEKAETAARCAATSLGDPPFTLVTE
jgi:hypothetical protein